MSKQIIFELVGGLGFFLFGMKLMSEGLRKVAGERLRQILEFLTKKPIIGILVGAGITALIQSSSATSVMVVGLVNAGLLTLKQAISVVLGANIGTTITAWLVSFLAIFKITNYALPAVGIGFLIATLGKARNTKLWGEVLLGFGILFIGIHFMKEAFAPLQESQQVKEIFINFCRYPVLGILAGTVITMLLQSSSATIALVQILAYKGLINFEAAIPLILGDNIGTTITAQLASIGTNNSARRTAMAHTMFNVIGTCYMLIFVYLGIYARAIDWMIPGPITTGNIMFHIAIAHSAFNIFNAIIVFLPLIGWLEKVSIKLVPGKPDLIEATPQYLERHLLDTPAVALEQATREIIRMGRLAQQAVNDAMGGFFTNNSKTLSQVAPREDAIDNLQKEITRYLVELSQKNLSMEESEKLPVLLHTVNDIERIGDHSENLVELGIRAIEQKLPFTSQAITELREMYEEADNMLSETIGALENHDSALAKRALKREETLNQLQIELRQNHVQRLNDRSCHLLSGLVFLDYVANLEKIGDHLTNIAQAIMGGLRWDGFPR
jgi:phosphate:Na+ symporter